MKCNEWERERDKAYHHIGDYGAHKKDDVTAKWRVWQAGGLMAIRTLATGAGAEG